MNLPHTYLGADGQTYEIIARRRPRFWPTRTELTSGLRNGSESAIGGMGQAFAVIGGVLLAGYVTIACLAAGPIGWFVGLTLIPLAFAIGAALGAVGFLVLAGLLGVAALLLPFLLLFKLL
jgi:hypothetical protein